MDRGNSTMESFCGCFFSFDALSKCLFWVMVNPLMGLFFFTFDLYGYALDSQKSDKDANT